MLRRLGLLILAFVLAGCGAGAIQTTPDEVLTVGGLKPNMKDKDAGLVAIAPGQVVMATADRRIAKVGGSSTELVEESFDDMARDLAKFLIRLSKGEAPKD